MIWNDLSFRQVSTTVALFKRFLDRILGIHLLKTVVPVPARRRVLQRADVIQPAKIAGDDGQRPRRKVFN